MKSNNSTFSGAFSSFTASLKPFGDSVSKTLSQAQQYAKEKMHTADVTPLPDEYRQLEEKVENIKLVYELFLRVTKNYTFYAYDYNPDMTEKLSDMASSAVNLANKLAGSTSTKQSQETPPSLSHALAKAAFHCTGVLDQKEPFCSALVKFAASQEKIGNARIQQDNDIISKFHKPFEATLGIKIDKAMVKNMLTKKSRRAVESARLTYDSFRSRYTTASPNTAESIRTEQTDAEDAFVQAVDDSMTKMKEAVETGEALKCLSDFVAIQLQYHKEAFEALSELSPEIDELVVTNEALYS